MSITWNPNKNQFQLGCNATKKGRQGGLQRLFEEVDQGAAWYVFMIFNKTEH